MYLSVGVTFIICHTTHCALQTVYDSGHNEGCQYLLELSKNYLEVTFRAFSLYQRTKEHFHTPCSTIYEHRDHRALPYRPDDECHVFVDIPAMGDGSS